MIAVLITVHNRIEKTCRCLRCLEKAISLAKDSVHIFLVDDASSDETADVLDKEFPQVRRINGDGDLYWNRGMHLAWQHAAAHADYDHYLWLNNDTYLFEESLDQLLAASSQLSDDSILCGQTISEGTSDRTYGGCNRGGTPLIYQDGRAPCDIINGNCVLIPRAVFNVLGFLDATFPHSIGDNDYSLRGAAAGIPSYAVKHPVAYCESNTGLATWENPKIPMSKRIHALYSPLCPGHPIHFFRFRWRHFGVRWAIRDFLSAHIKVVFPRIKKSK